MSLKPYDFGVATKRVLPFRALKNSTLFSLDPARIISLMTWAAKENLIEAVSFADDDLLKWTPENTSDYQDKNNSMWKRLSDIKAALDGAGLSVHSFACDLTGNACFAHGSFANNDQRVRDLARKKCERALEIGRFLNASVFTLEGDMDGFDSVFNVNWKEAPKRIAAALDGIADTIHAQGMTNYKGACLAPKQSSVYVYGYVNTVSSALNVVNGMLKNGAFWGVAPASSQLAEEGWTNAPAVLAQAVAHSQMAYLKVGGGICRPARRAPHPILGTANLTEMTQLFWMLGQLGWKGAVELDNVASVSDAKSGNDEITCKQFIANNANALTIALELANSVRTESLAELMPSEADLMAAALMGRLDVDAVIMNTIKQGKCAAVQEPAGEQRPAAAPQQSSAQPPQAADGNGDQQNQQGGGRKDRRNRRGRNRQNQPRQEGQAPAQPAPAPAGETAPVASPAPDAAPAPVAAVEPADAPVEKASPAPVAGDVAPVVDANATVPAAPKRENRRHKAAPAPLPPPAPFVEETAEAQSEGVMPVILPEEKKTARKRPARKSASPARRRGRPAKTENE